MPMIGERFREWLKPLLMKKGLGLMEKPRVYPRKKKVMLVTCRALPCKKKEFLDKPIDQRQA